MFVLAWIAAPALWPAVDRALRSPRDAVYPPQSIRLNFDHAQHLQKAGVECLDCHASVMQSVRVSDRNLPSESDCLECHDVRAEDPTTAEPPAACDTCHPGFRPESKADTPARTEMPPAALRFGHRPHLARKIPCQRCHAGVEDAALATVEYLPMMDVCTSCHDGETAPAECATCHLAGPDGRLRTDLPGGRLLPRGRFRNDDHRGDIVRNHGPAARADAAYCRSCHAERECVRCHDGAFRPIEVHPADYLLTHPIDARKDAPRCQTCHRTATDCIDCHVRSGVTDHNSARRFGAGANLGARFHPPGWVDEAGGMPGPNHHRFDARRHLATCASCHSESSCIVCHSADAPTSLRASPHPPGFRAFCGRARRLNDRGCLACHRDRAALDAACNR